MPARHREAINRPFDRDLQPAVRCKPLAPSETVSRQEARATKTQDDRAGLGHRSRRQLMNHQEGVAGTHFGITVGVPKVRMRGKRRGTTAPSPADRRVSISWITSKAS